MHDERGVPYPESSPLRCTFVLDDSRFHVHVCNDSTAWQGCSWCEKHLGIVAPRAFARMQRAVRLAA